MTAPRRRPPGPVRRPAPRGTGAVGPRRARRRGPRPAPGCGAAAHPGDHAEVGREHAGAALERPEHRFPYGVGPGAGQHHPVRHIEDVGRVHADVGAGAVRGGVGVQQHLEARRGGGPYGGDGRLLERTGDPAAPAQGGVREFGAEEPADAAPAGLRGAAAGPGRFQGAADGGGQFVRVGARLPVALAALRAEAERQGVLRRVAEPDAGDLVVGVEVGEAVPAAGLQLGAARAGPGGGLRGQVHEVRAHGGTGDAGGPGVAVPVRVADRGVRVLGTEAGAVREDDPAVHLETGGGQRFGRLPVRVVARHPALPVRGEGAPRPAVRVRRVEDGGVFGGDDAVGGVAGVRARVEW